MSQSLPQSAFLLPLSPSSYLFYYAFKSQSSHRRLSSVIHSAKEAILRLWSDAAISHSQELSKVPLVAVDPDSLEVWIFTLDSELTAFAPQDHNLVGSHSNPVLEPRQRSLTLTMESNL